MNSKLWLAVLLIVGTSVGAGMLALPVEVGQAGFVPSVSLFLIVWAVMFFSGIFFAEVLVAHKTGSNFITLSENLLGKKATRITFFFYFLLFFSLITAYIRAMGILLYADFPWLINAELGSLFFVLCMLPILYMGAETISKLNGALTLFLVVSYIALIIIGLPHIHKEYLLVKNWSRSFVSLSLIITSFGFHGTLPSLVDYLNRDLKQIRLAIFIGITITLFIYLFWQFITLGSIPLEGPVSLHSALKNDQTAISPMNILFGNHIFSLWARIFSFSALITSFLGVSLGLIDFCIDAFQLSKRKFVKASLIATIYIPSLLLSSTVVHIFHCSLKYGAGVASVFLLIFLPTLMNQVSFPYTYTEKALLISFQSTMVRKAVLLFSILACLSCLF